MNTCTGKNENFLIYSSDGWSGLILWHAVSVKNAVLWVDVHFFMLLYFACLL